VARDYGFTERVVEETGLTHRKIIQNGQNDYRFLESLADRNGFELFAAGETFYFRAPKGDRAPRLTLRYGESLESFSPELNSGEQVAEVTVRHWDPTKGTEIVGTAKRDTGRERGGGKTGSGKRVLRVPVRSAAEADRVAEAAMARIEAGLVTGGGETVGLPEIRAGETLGLVGLGERFSSGPDAATHYYVESATHRLDDSGYRTSFEVTETTT
jgi:phage protein D